MQSSFLFLYLVDRTRIIRLQIDLADVNKEVPSYLITKTMSGNPQETTENTRMLQGSAAMPN